MWTGCWYFRHANQEPQTADWRHYVLKGPSKLYCKQKPENPPAASINIVPNTHTFTDKRQSKHHQNKIMEKIFSRQILHSYSSLIVSALITRQEGQWHYAVAFIFSRHSKVISDGFY